MFEPVKLDVVAEFALVLAPPSSCPVTVAASCGAFVISTAAAII